ncbi:unnamed protein product, partial [Mesorhabditis belari]|uniref:F-box domain-containing protein n=1 Tax=Mesorhabditis belari TaxID=2138241 RepID=A0AAF3FGX2_9BILA
MKEKRSLSRKITFQQDKSPESSNRTEMVDQDRGILEVFKRCDPVTLRKCSQVCRNWRHIILTRAAQQEDQNIIQKIDEEEEPALRIASFGRLYVADRKRIILERLLTKDELLQQENDLLMDEKHSAITPPIKVRESKTTARDSLRNLTITPTKLNDSVYADQQVAAEDGTSWAFSWNVNQWLKDYEIKEVVCHNFCAFLEREVTEMAEPTPYVAGTNRQGTIPHAQSIAGLNTPPWSPANSPFQTSGMSGGQIATTTNGTQYLRDISTTWARHDLQIWSGETMEEVSALSSGRIERLARVLSEINPLHLVIKDTTRRKRRPLRMVFFAIKLLRKNLRELTLENLTGSETVELGQWLSLNDLERLIIKQPSEHAALRVDEKLLCKWLRIPENRRARISIELHGCKELKAEGLVMFIKAWQLAPAVCEFNWIKIDCETLQPVVFLALMDTKPNERLSAKLFREFTQKASLKERKVLFHHERGGSAIRFSTDGKMITLECIDVPATKTTETRKSSRKSVSRNRTLEICQRGGRNVSRKESFTNLLATGDVARLMKSFF